MGVEKNEKNERRIVKKKEEETKNGLGRSCTRGQKNNKNRNRK
jgi:hypothetical protein